MQSARSILPVSAASHCQSSYGANGNSLPASCRTPAKLPPASASFSSAERAAAPIQAIAAAAASIDDLLANASARAERAHTCALSSPSSSSSSSSSSFSSTSSSAASAASPAASSAFSPAVTMSSLHAAEHAGWVGHVGPMAMASASARAMAVDDADFSGSASGTGPASDGKSSGGGGEDQHRSASRRPPVRVPRTPPRQSRTMPNGHAQPNADREGRHEGSPAGLSQPSGTTAAGAARPARQPQRSIYETVFGPAFKQLHIEPTTPPGSISGSLTATQTQQQQQQPQKQSQARRAPQQLRNSPFSSTAVSAGNTASSSPSNSDMTGTASLLSRAAASPQLGSPSRPGGPRFDPHNHPTQEQRKRELQLAFAFAPLPQLSPHQKHHHGQQQQQHVPREALGMRAGMQLGMKGELALRQRRQSYADDQVPNFIAGQRPAYHAAQPQHAQPLPGQQHPLVAGTAAVTAADGSQHAPYPHLHGYAQGYAQGYGPTFWHGSPPHNSNQGIRRQTSWHNHRAIAGAISSAPSSNATTSAAAVASTTPTKTPSPRHKRIGLAGLGISTPSSATSSAGSPLRSASGRMRTSSRDVALLGAGGGAGGNTPDPLAFLPNGHPASSLAKDLGIAHPTGAGAALSRSRNTSVNGVRFQHQGPHDASGGSSSINSLVNSGDTAAEDAAERDRVASFLAAISDERSSARMANGSGAGGGQSPSALCTSPRRPLSGRLGASIELGFARPSPHGMTPRSASSTSSAAFAAFTAGGSHSGLTASPAAHRKSFPGSPRINGSATLSDARSEPVGPTSTAGLGSGSKSRNEERAQAEPDEGEAAELMLLLATSPSPATDTKNRSRFAGATPSLLGNGRRQRIDSSGVARSLFQDVDPLLDGLGAQNIRHDRAHKDLINSQESDTTMLSLAPSAAIGSDTTPVNSSSASNTQDGSASDGESNNKDNCNSGQIQTPPRVPPSARLPHASDVIPEDCVMASDVLDASANALLPLPSTPPGGPPRTPKAPGTNFSYADFLNVSPSPQPRSRRTPRMRGVSATGVFDPFPSELNGGGMGMGTPSRHNEKAGRFTDVAESDATAYVFQRGPLTYGDEETQLQSEVQTSPANKASGRPRSTSNASKDDPSKQESPSKRARLAAGP
ncbi:hypothetical protein K437DRAFT_181546 [Tilletiaria anomala UBC 951]|uniref:Uncharacterized protein n=1 Tax=Tilletiaria anomala (strain ATCC 24038 / CBS 436.72 / UBC 951) TaxID=1037660 RepID=A0A066VKZ9_TILAU|nr:uncharacterized protein K437DRAFT_181546 [Tilletiaria anomala UBC 951]KDN40973.1 hypothetical protein K437DRAFT_181546 [Tilletiaria anomala UBC 951]